MKQFLPIILIACLMASCGYKSIYKSGTYKVQSRNGDTTKFYNIKKTYLVYSDTLKAGDKIKVRMITPKMIKRSKQLGKPEFDNKN